MIATVRFMPVARQEVAGAHAWYAERAAALGERFIDEVDRVVGMISANPEGFPVLHRDLRRARLRRFPYSLFYRAAPEGCFVVACFHAKRDPGRWEAR